MSVGAIGGGQSTAMISWQKQLADDQKSAISDQRAKASQQLRGVDQAKIAVYEASIAASAKIQPQSPAQPINWNNAVYM